MARVRLPIGTFASVLSLTLALGTLLYEMDYVQRPSTEIVLLATTASAASSPSISLPFLADKRNILNQLFVKNAWGWTSVAVVLLILASVHSTFNVHRMNASSSDSTRKRVLYALLRYALMTSYWFLLTQWFIGPSILDRIFVYTGGECLSPPSPPASFFSRNTQQVDISTYNSIYSSHHCRRQGGIWSLGHDISGHAFILLLSALYLISELHILRPKSRLFLRSLLLRFPVVLLVWLWWVMLAATAVYFHSWQEKVTGWVFGITFPLLIYGPLKDRLVPREEMWVEEVHWSPDSLDSHRNGSVDAVQRKNE